MALYQVKQCETYGRGLYARTDLKRGVIIEMAELLVLSESDTVKVNQTDLQYYTFKYNDKQDCLVMGNGEIFNHSDEPNVSYTLTEVLDKEGKFLRHIMVFETIKPIKEGEQLFINYAEDVNVDATKYKGVNLV